MNSIKAFLYKYRHAWILSYSFIYIPWFCYLEKAVTRNYHVMHVALDDFIPFNEYFIVPYMMWFLYVAGAILYFLLTSKEDFYRICTFLFSGMTISLIICTFFRNGTDFRPALDPGKNVFTSMVAALYRTDTPTNVFPSTCVQLHRHPHRHHEERGAEEAPAGAGRFRHTDGIHLPVHRVLKTALRH